MELRDLGGTKWCRTSHINRVLVTKSEIRGGNKTVEGHVMPLFPKRGLFCFVFSSDSLFT